MVSGDTQHPTIVMVIKTSTKIAIRKQTYKGYPQAPPGRDLIYPDFNLPILQTSFKGHQKSDLQRSSSRSRYVIKSL